jgi:hypothetical protein
MFLEPGVERDLQLIARREGRSTAAVVREALGAYIAARKSERTRRPGFVAAGRSGVTDTAERHESLLFDAVPGDGPSPPASDRQGRRATPRRAGTRRRR